jgi:DNA repair photolyase
MRDLFSYFDEQAISRDQDERRTIRANEIICRTALSRSRLPGLDCALNPYEGCEHGCVYCYAPYILRTVPSEWGRWVNAKVNIPSVLSGELRGKRGVVGVGTVTDPYQPTERVMSLTHSCLAELLKSDLRISILTKSDLVLRDLPMLTGSSMVEVGITITTQDDGLAAEFEPNASPPSKRLRALEEMSAEGIETYALVGPIIPFVTDIDLNGLVSEIAETGARRIMVDRLRLRPGMLDKIHELSMFRDYKFRGDFDTRALSASYFSSIELRIRELAKDAGLAFESVF